MGSGAGNFIASLFILCGVLPVLLGCVLSLLIAGKGHRLMWILPMIALRFLSVFVMQLLGITSDKKLIMENLASEWIIAAVLIIGAAGYRMMMTPGKKKLADQTG
ncbi:hypothetical protein ACO0LC_19015 [Undibacterium sp. JH2W]|uniref:hypothetical protein n=1 Tax=Undibacterium sp. JH2W TaxID=3413037 RepID=UPI003BF217A4